MPSPDESSGILRSPITIVALGIAGIGLALYVATSTGGRADAVRENAKLRAQIAPIQSAAHRAFPTDDDAEAMRRLAERLETLYPTVTSRTFTTEQREALLSALRADQTPGRTVWLVLAPNAEA